MFSTVCVFVQGMVREETELISQVRTFKPSDPRTCLDPHTDPFLNSKELNLPHMSVKQESSTVQTA